MPPLPMSEPVIARKPPDHTEIFRRKEIKYLLTPERYEALREFFGSTLEVDRYGRQTVRSVYYDTPGFDLIRRSLQHPDYKEKLRVRGYGGPDSGMPMFAEIKKKLHGIVYKRRVPFDGGLLPGCLPERFDRYEEEITRRELMAMFEHYRLLRPACFIACERTACVGPEDLRVTFDEDLRFRTDRLSLLEQTDGRPILKPGTVVMEVKYPGGAPLWISDAFSRMGIFP